MVLVVVVVVVVLVIMMVEVVVAAIAKNRNHKSDRASYGPMPCSSTAGYHFGKLLKNFSSSSPLTLHPKPPTP